MPRGSRGGRDRGSLGGTAIFICDLPPKVRKADLQDTFRLYGEISDIDIMEGTGEGYVDFTSPKVVDQVLKMVDRNINFLVLGKRVSVKALSKKVWDAVKQARDDRAVARREEDDRKKLSFPKHPSARSRSRRSRRSPVKAQPRRHRTRSRGPPGSSRKVTEPSHKPLELRPRVVLRSRSRASNVLLRTGASDGGGVSRELAQAEDDEPDRYLSEEPISNAGEASRAVVATKKAAIERRASDFPRHCKNIFIRVLPHYITEENLAARFREFGSITKATVKESKIGFNYGVVSFSDSTAATRAFLHATEINGTPIELSPDKQELRALDERNRADTGLRGDVVEKPLGQFDDVNGRGRNRSRRRGHDSHGRRNGKRETREVSRPRRDQFTRFEIVSRKVFIKSVPATVDSQRLRMLMEQFGTVESAEAVPARSQGFVVFGNDKDVQRVVTMERLRVDGVDMTFERYTLKPGKVLRPNHNAPPRSTSPSPSGLKFRTQPSKTSVTKKMRESPPTAPQPKRALVNPNYQIRPPDRDLIDYLTDEQKKMWYKVNHQERKNMKSYALRMRELEFPESGAVQQDKLSGDSDEDEYFADDNEDDAEIVEGDDNLEDEEKDYPDNDNDYWEDDAGYEDVCIPEILKEPQADNLIEDEEDDGSWEL